MWITKKARAKSFLPTCPQYEGTSGKKRETKGFGGDMIVGRPEGRHFRGVGRGAKR